MARTHPQPTPGGWQVLEAERRQCIGCDGTLWAAVALGGASAATQPPPLAWSKT